MTELEMNQDFKDILATEIEHVASCTPIAPFIMGEPGIGKSSIVKAMCKEHLWWFFELLCNQLGDRSDLTGCRSVKDTVKKPDGSVEEIWKQIFFPHQAIQDAITCANEHPDDIVVLFLDEINRTSSDITSAILSFTTARKIGTYTFPDNVRFIVAGNDNGNITALDSASISRFAKYKLRPSANTYMSIEENLNSYIKDVLKANPTFIFGKGSGIVTSQVSDGDGADDEKNFTSEYEIFDDAAEGFEQITTPRTLSGLNAFLNTCDSRKLAYYCGQIYRDANTGEDVSLLRVIIEGHVGRTQFTDAIVAAITTDVQTGTNRSAATVANPTKPAVYNSILKCTDRQTRDTMLQNMDDLSRSQILLYACWEKGKDNSDLISAVCATYQGDMLDMSVQPHFSKLCMLDEMDPDNYNAFIATGCKPSVIIRSIMGH